jgi:hypothetical protein
MSRWTLTFPACIDYGAHDEITIEIDLISKDLHVTFGDKLDSGGKFCIFQPHFAEWPGLDLTSGIPEKIRAAAGSFPAYGHEVTLQVGDLQWDTTVYFACSTNGNKQPEPINQPPSWKSSDCASGSSRLKWSATS